MSIKKLFDSNKRRDVLVSTNLEEEIVKNSPELESADNIREKIKDIERYVPPVDFEDPANFVKYGSAQSYYEDSINRVLAQYPYDGSEEEINEYLNESNYLDLYMLDTKYPRTTGYANFAIADDPDATAIVPGRFYSSDAVKVGWTEGASTVEYIKVFGGPHTASAGMPAGKIHTSFTGSNYYDTDIYETDGTLALERVGSRESNLKFNLTNGVTTEFWLNINSDWPNNAAVPANQIIYDQWNGAASSSAGYGRLMIYVTGAKGASLLNGSNPIGVHLASGSNVWDIQFGGSTFTTGSLKDTWNHLAFSFVTSSTNLEAKFYLNGTLHETKTNTTITSFGEVTGSLIAYLGAGQTAVSGANTAGVTSMSNPFCPLSGSLDEFRYWKTARTEKEIQQNYWTQVRGGSNNEVANAELGVYYKFNEGITGTSSFDATVLDYSGRISNGTWVNYPGSAARNTGSAIVSASAAPSEFADPIIYGDHPDVKSLYSTYSTTGSMYDTRYQNSLLDSMPSWIIDQDEFEGNLSLKKLTQIMGSYFDTLDLQVSSLAHLKDVSYLSSSSKPIPFARNLLSARGLAVPDMFVDADILERFANRRGDREYDLNLHEVKNMIYQNIYNNLVYIYKSKGTQKALRNLVHCYGIGDDIIKFNAYGNNTEFKLEDTGQATVVRKNYIDFNHTDRHGGTVYQNTSSVDAALTAGVTYVSGTNKFWANTAEVEVIFPRKIPTDNKEFVSTPFVSSSIFGCRTAEANATRFFTPSGAEKSFQLYAVKTHTDSLDGHFQLKTPSSIFNLTSSIYSNIYDNQKWNFAVRLYHQDWPRAQDMSGVIGAAAEDKVKLEWYGVNVEQGIVRNEFTLTASALADEFLTEERRYYIGASRTDYTGSVLTNSDVRISSLRHWTTYIDNAVVKQHAKDPENVGTKHPTRNMIFIGRRDDAAATADNETIPEAAALALHWDFSQITGSDASGEFIVKDASSGSVSLRSRYDNHSGSSHIIGNQYAGVGYFPSSPSATGVVSKEYVQSLRQGLPETVNTDEAVNVLSRDDELFPRDAAVSQTFFAFEKSMYGVISQEMINMFGTIVEFNNIIGELTSKYRGDHKSLRLLRQLFFEKIQNSPDLDKFIDYYKWLDSSIIIFLQQLIPASSNVSEEIRVMVESHVLERNKYRHQYPFLDFKGNSRWGGDEAKLEGRVKGIRELEYNWQFGHAPTTNSETEHSIWWKQRAERDNVAFNTAALIDTARQTLNDIILSFNSASVSQLNTGAGESGVYDGSTYALRRFSDPVRLSTAFVDDIGGGYNYPRGHKPDAIFPLIPVGGALGFSRYPIKKFATPDIAKEELRPVIRQEKRAVLSVMPHQITQAEEGGYIRDNKNLVPFVAYSSSASPAGGFGQQFTSEDLTPVASAEEFAGYHNDSYGDDYEIPMQSPFTNQHVGGHRHRHTDLNEGSDARDTRPEAFHLQRPDSRTRFLPADAIAGGISTNPSYRRDETAKRPVNIKNVKHRTGSLGTVAMGNFDKRYEIVNTTGRTQNNAAFVKNEGFSTASVTTLPLGYFEGLIDYAKPVRRRTEHVIVSRFSAPGGPDTAGDNQGGAGLDYEAAELSPYNNLNYRNTTVRGPLQTLLTERSEQFGLRSGSAVSSADYTSVTASYHKVNRNPLKRMQYSNEYSLALGVVNATSSFDNYYVQHMIPRSDYQYTWITASYESSNTIIHGYFPYDGFVSTSAGLVGALNFASSSEIGSKLNSGRRRAAGPTADHKANFVGMNAEIVEPISASDFTIGYPLTADLRNYYNYGDIGSFALATENQESFIEQIQATSDMDAYVLPQLLLFRNGTYGYPTWKQLRVGQTQLARHYRKNNIYTHTPEGDEPLTFSTDAGQTTVPVRYRSTISHTQSPVDITFKPLVFKLQVEAGEADEDEPATATMVVKTSFENPLTYFKSADLNEALGLRIKTKDTSYRSMYKLYKKNANRQRKTKDPNSPVLDLLSLRYGEVVYPSRDHLYSETVRGRTNYQNDFWRDSRADRTTLGLSKKPRNVATASVTQSAWSLDAQENFATGIYGTSTGISGGLDEANLEGRRAGQLQNEYVHFHAATASQAQPGILYARKQIMPLTSSIQPPWGMPRSSISIQNSGRVPDFMKPKSLYRAEANWDAGATAGRYEGTSSTFVQKPVNPFTDDYDTWFSEIKGKGQSYTIVPEFRISEHIKFYKDNGLDFLVENEKLFEIPGCPTASTIPQNSAEDNFYTTFSNSDFLKYFEVIKEDHAKIDNDEPIEPHTISLRCKALKKFIAYDGFYPAERTVQMAEQFVKEYSGSLQYLETQAGAPAKQSLRTFLKPLFAPGILYNTIKSGVAVDYPILTGSAYPVHAAYSASKGSAGFFGGSYRRHELANSGAFAIFGGSYTGSASPNLQSVTNHDRGWDHRLPFETLLEPENYLTNITIADDEPSALTSISSLVSWAGTGDTEYKKMMNNFLAETVNTFLYKSELSAIESKPQRDWLDVEPGQPYGMRVKMWRSMDKGRVQSGSWGNFPVPQNLPVISRFKNNRSEFPPSRSGTTRADPFTGETITLGTDVTPRETFTMYNRPAAFGPALGLYAITASQKLGNASPFVSTASQINVHEFEFSPENGVYASHTPPYYDGECWFDIIFWPKGLETNPPPVGTIADNPILFRFKADEEGTPFRPTFGDIKADVSPTIFTNRPVPVGSSTRPQYPLAGSFKRKWRYDPFVFHGEANTKISSLHDAYKATPSGFHRYSADVINSAGGSMTDVTYTPRNSLNHITVIGPAAAPWVNQWAMQLDASLDIFKQGRLDESNDLDRTWKIQTKFETPMLNFIHVTGADGTLTPPGDTTARSTIPRGMWHQFGRVPQGDEGVYIQVTDIPSGWLNNHPSASLRRDLRGLSSPDNKTLYASLTDLNTYYGKYSLPITATGSTASDATDNFTIPEVKSLTEICGFNTDPVRVGRLKERKKISEAVVAVPFTLVDGEKKFFGCLAPDSVLYDEFAGKNVKKLRRMMNKYVFPPTFDFVNNEGINPVAMYVFEFSHTLDKDDISHMWQNIPPKLGNKAEVSVSSVTHRLLATELLGDTRYLNTDVPAAKDQPFTGGTLSSELRWMVFKVKRRAANDYNFTTGKSSEKTMPTYSYNWPYDFFSMVELVSLEASFEFKHIPEDKKADPAALLETPEDPEPDLTTARLDSSAPTRAAAAASAVSRAAATGGSD